MWLCFKRSYNREVVGVRQRRPRAKFNLHFINLASVYVNCLMNGPKSGKKETYSKPRVLSGNQSSSELTRHPRETLESTQMLWRPLEGPLTLPKQFMDTVHQGSGLALRGNESPWAQASAEHVIGPRTVWGPSRAKVAQRCCWYFSENMLAGRRLMWEVTLTQMLA